MRSKVLIAAFTLGALTACGHSEGSVYTLYRDSLVVDGARVHVATFDAADGEDYNRENCELARDLFNGQDGVKTKFWCEKGHYRGRG